MASHLNATLRLSLIFHEVKLRIGTKLHVAIGEPIPFETLSSIKDRQALADELCRRSYALATGESTTAHKAMFSGPSRAPGLFTQARGGF